VETLPIGVLVVAVIATVAVVIGVAFGIVVAPRLGRLFDRVDADDDEGPGDRAD
jgi:ABC-type dipeptide/oligopeptide/nickel transport system permease component